MARTSEYRLVIGSDQDAFERDVNEALAEGWELYGSPIVRSGRDMGQFALAGAMFYCQAVVRTATSSSGNDATHPLDVP